MNIRRAMLAALTVLTAALAVLNPLWDDQCNCAAGTCELTAACRAVHACEGGEIVLTTYGRSSGFEPCWLAGAGNRQPALRQRSRRGKLQSRPSPPAEGPGRCSRGQWQILAIPRASEGCSALDSQTSRTQAAREAHVPCVGPWSRYWTSPSGARQS